MDISISAAGRVGARMLREAMARGGADRIMLAPGRYPIGILPLDREIELIGSAGTSLDGAIRVQSRGRVRMVGVAVDGCIEAGGFGMIELRACAINARTTEKAALALSGQVQAIISRTVIDGGDGVGLCASDQAAGLVDQCRIAGAVAAVRLGTRTTLVLRSSQVRGG